MASIGFQREAKTLCDLCTLETGSRRELDPGYPPQRQACQACSTDFETGGLEFQDRVRPFRRTTAFRRVGVRLEDLAELATFLFEQCGCEGTPPADLISGAVNPMHELLSLRPDLEQAASRGVTPPSPGARGATTAKLTAALVAGALLKNEALAQADLERLLMRVDHRGAVELLVALHMHWRASTGRAVCKPNEHRKALLEFASRAYLRGAPPEGLDWTHRLTILDVDLHIELADRKTAEQKLRSLPGEQDVRTMRDPRALHLRTAIALAESQLDAADKRLQAMADWLASNPESAAWPDIAEATHLNRYIRATSRHRSENWGDATDALRSVCRVRPNDVAMRFELAHTYLARSQATVAREVLASVLDDEAITMFQRCYEFMERRSEGVYLYASCLLRIGRHKSDVESIEQARRAIEKHFECDDEHSADDWVADLHRLWAECCLLRGEGDQALDHVLIAFEASPDDARAHDVWVALHAVLVETLNGAPEDEPGARVLDAIVKSSPALQRRFNLVHREGLRVEFEPILPRDAEGLRTPSGQSGIWLPPNVEATHPDGFTWLAYQQFHAKNFLEAWKRDGQARRLGAVPVPFRVMRDMRRAHERGNPSDQDLLARALIAWLLAIG